MEKLNSVLYFHAYCNWGHEDFSGLGLIPGGWWLGTGGFGSTGGTNRPGLTCSLGILSSTGFSVNLGLLLGSGGGVRGERFKVFSFSHPSGVARTRARGRGSGGNEQDSLTHAGFLRRGRGGTGGSCSLGLQFED